MKISEIVLGGTKPRPVRSRPQRLQQKDLHKKQEEKKTANDDKS